MSNIIWIISTILIFSVMSISIKAFYSNKKNNFSNVLKPNKLFFIIGVCGAIFFFIATIVGWFLDTTTAYTYKILYCFLIIAFSMFVYGYLIFFYINYKIIVFDEYFIYQNFWRIKKKIYYKEIEINKTKIYPEIRLKKKDGKAKLIFKLAGILENENAFTESYKNWKSKHKSNNNQV